MPSFLAFLAMALPWVNPFTSGPSPAVVPLLFSWACALVLMVFVQASFFQRSSCESFPRWVAFAWLTSALLSSVLALVQYFGYSTAFQPWINNAVLGEAYANLRQRNQFATLTNIGLAALLWSAMRPAARQVKRMYWYLALFGSIAVLAIGNAASSSRTGLLQVIFLMILAGVWDRLDGRLNQTAKYRALMLSGLAYGLAYLCATFALPVLAGLQSNSSGILTRIQDDSSGCSSRMILWSNVLHLISLKPWTGWGWGELDYAHFMTFYDGPRFCEILDNAHNLPLHLAVELGLPIALLVCGLTTWLVIRGKPWQEVDSTRQMAWAILALIMLHSMLEYPLWYGPFQVTFALCVWFLWPRPSINRSLTPAIATGIASLLIAGTAYAAWDYHRISQIYLAPDERTETYQDNTLEKLKASWLFWDQVRFAELTTAELTQENAAQINTLAKEVMHFSPEARGAKVLRAPSCWDTVTRRCFSFSVLKLRIRKTTSSGRLQTPALRA